MLSNCLRFAVCSLLFTSAASFVFGQEFNSPAKDYTIKEVAEEFSLQNEIQRMKNGNLLETEGIYLEINQTENAELPQKTKPESNVKWKPLIYQSLLRLTIENSVRIMQEKTREELGGPFFKDWYKSATTWGLWDDGDSWKTNWILHPLGGSFSCFMFAEKDKISKEAKFGWNKNYFRAKKRQILYAAIYSAAFELGPISESSIGNVGLHPDPSKHKGRQTLQDHIVTPLVGGALSIAEDSLRAKVICPLAKKNKVLGRILSIPLNPTRSAIKIWNKFLD